MRQFARTLLAGLSLALLWRPPAAWRLRPASHFWWLLVLGIGVSAWRDWMLIDGPARFYAEGIQGDALGALLLLGAAVVAASATGQRVQAWSIAVHASAASLWIGLGLVGLRLALGQIEELDATQASQWLLVASCAWWTLALLRVLSFALPAARVWARLVLAPVAAALTLAPFFAIEAARYWYPDYEALAQARRESAESAPAREVRGSAEALLYAQRERVERALDALHPGEPGRPDAFLLAFGGDANEDVFRNEVLYAQRLFAQRFGMQARTLVLLNHPDTTDEHPLATLSNLRLALAGIGSRMQRDEDLLVLFATTHGSEDHELYVDLQPLPLDQINPADLRGALDGAGIDWRVLVVSACYSGGFVDALRSPQSLVITAARSDRSSFGCGAESELTYFGRAFLVEALNRTQSFVDAFALAQRRVAKMEKAEDFDPSEPQIDRGERIEAFLAGWEATLAPAAEVAWEPREPKAACEREPDCAPQGASAGD